MENHKTFTNLINKRVKNKFHVKYGMDNVKILTTDQNDYENLLRRFKESEVNFHTYTLKTDKRKTYVLSGLHTQVSIEEIKAEIEEQGLMVHNVSRMKGTKRLLFMITVPATYNLSQMNSKIQSICYTKIQWEYYISKRRLAQCHRCQEWGYATSNRFAEVACLKCAKPHLTRESPKPRSKPALIVR